MIHSISKSGVIAVNRKSSAIVVLINSTVEGMTNTQLSAIAQQVIDMQDEEDEAPPRTGYTTEEDPVTPTRAGSGRPIRQSASRTRNHSSLLPDAEGSSKTVDLERTTPQKQRRKSNGAEETQEAITGSGRKRKPSKPDPKPKKMVVPKPKRQRTFNGRVSMTARPLGRGDGRKRGQGIWPEKGQNTVKGNMVGALIRTFASKTDWGSKRLCVIL